MAPPFRADHIGSLIRPSHLLSARATLDSIRFASSTHAKITGAIAPEPSQATASDVARIQAETIQEVVSKQISLGIAPITSGEFERWVFCDGFFSNLQGIELRYADFLADCRPGLPQARKALVYGEKGRPLEVATGKVQWTRSPYLEDWLHLRSLLPRERWGDAKVTLPTPEWFHLQRKDGTAYDRGVYASDEELLSDLSKATKKELLTLYHAGLRVAQIDNPNLTFFCDAEFQEDSNKAGTNLDKLLDSYIKCLNDVVEGLPEDMHVGIHLCRGNYPKAEFVASGGYEQIAAKLLTELNFKLYYLEFDSDRAGDFQPLRVLPVDKAVVLGIVTTKYAELESVDQLKARVYQAADVIAQGQGRTREDVLRDNLAVSPQCGFASVNFGKGQGMDEEVQWQKLELVKKVADEIWSSEA